MKPVPRERDADIDELVEKYLAIDVRMLADVIRLAARAGCGGGSARCPACAWCCHPRWPAAPGCIGPGIDRGRAADDR